MIKVRIASYQRWIQSIASNTKSFDRDISKIRNIGIIAHIDAGKTTTTERILFYSGYTKRLGNVDEGSTVTDYLSAERERGITITSAAIPLSWKEHRINLIDTPGHIDFTFEVERSIRVLDGAIVILDGVAGVEAQSQNVWNQANAYQIPRIIYVNKMDREGSCLQKAIASIESRLKGWGKPLVCQWPVILEDVPSLIKSGSGGSSLTGILDIVSLQVLDWKEDPNGSKMTVTPLDSFCSSHSQIGTHLKERAIALREELIEKLSEMDEDIVNVFLEYDGDPLQVPDTEIKKALRRVTLSGQGVVVLCGASYKNMGVQPILDAVIDLLPHPMDRPNPIALDENGRQVQVSLDDTKDSALAFKVINDPKRGPLVFVRVYSGSIQTSSQLINTTRQIKEKNIKTLQMYADEYEAIPCITTGNIAVLTGLKHTKTGDTLLNVNDKRQIQLLPMKIPPPVFIRSIEGASPSEEKRLSEALTAIMREDPSLHVQVDQETGQTLLSGMGELHLEITSERITEEYKVKCQMGPVRISYREHFPNISIQQQFILEKELFNKKIKVGIEMSVSNVQNTQDDNMIAIQSKYNQTDVCLDDSTIYIGSLPLSNHPNILANKNDYPSKQELKCAIVEGIESFLSRGPLFGFPMVNCNIKLHKLILFGADMTTCGSVRMAAYQLLQNIAKQAQSHLLEPIMNVSLRVPNKYTGVISRDVSGARRGHIVSLETQEMDNTFAYNRIEAHVPLAELMGYSSHLRSQTAGNGDFTMDLIGFGIISSDQESKIIQKLRGY